MRKLINLLETVAFGIGLKRAHRQKMSEDGTNYQPETIEPAFTKTWFDIFSEEEIAKRICYRGDAVTAFRIILKELGEDFANIAADQSIILSDSRRPGSLGKARSDHGELIASLIRKRVEEFDAEASKYFSKLE